MRVRRVSQEELPLNGETGAIVVPTQSAISLTIMVDLSQNGTRGIEFHDSYSRHSGYLDEHYHCFPKFAKLV